MKANREFRSKKAGGRSCFPRYAFGLGQKINAAQFPKATVAQTFNADGPVGVWIMHRLMMDRAKRHGAVMPACHPAAVDAGSDMVNRSAAPTDEAREAGNICHVRAFCGCRGLLRH